MNGIRQLLALAMLATVTPLTAAPVQPGNQLLSPIPVPVPEQQSPVELFRQLMAKSPGERDEYLARQSPSLRGFLRQRLQQYAAMGPEARELKLQTTELRFFLRPQLTASPAQRQIMLATTPDHYRETVRLRIERWNKLPAELQAHILKNESLLGLILQIGQPTASGLTKNLSPEVSSELKAWNALPQDDRLQMLSSFRSFFSFSDLEKSRIIASLPQYQRHKITGTLTALEDLPPAERAACLNALQRFGSMSVAEQQRFFRNAEAWRKITPAEQTAWRMVVREFPPLPGNFQKRLNTAAAY
jgi:hypothetical protein